MIKEHNFITLYLSGDEVKRILHSLHLPPTEKNIKKVVESVRANVEITIDSPDMAIDVYNNKYK